MELYNPISASEFSREMVEMPQKDVLEFMLAFALRFCPNATRSRVTLFVSLVSKSNENKFLVNQDVLISCGLITSKTTYYTIKKQLTKINMRQNVDWVMLWVGGAKTYKNQKISMSPKALFALIESKRLNNVLVWSCAEQFKCLGKGVIHFMEYEIMRKQKLNKEMDTEIQFLRNELEKNRNAITAIIEYSKNMREYVQVLETKNNAIMDENRILNENNKYLFDCVASNAGVVDILDTPQAKRPRTGYSV